MGKGLLDNLSAADRAALAKETLEKAKTYRADILFDRLEDFMTKVLDKDLAKVIASGMVDGFFQGKADAHREVATEMLEKGYDLPLVYEMTGLSEADIDKMQQKDSSYLADLGTKLVEMGHLAIVEEEKKKAESKGKTEGKAQVAVQMLQEGCDYSFISRVTGLSETGITRLKNGK